MRLCDGDGESAGKFQKEAGEEAGRLREKASELEKTAVDGVIQKLL